MMQPKITTLTRIKTAMISQCRMSSDSNMLLPPHTVDYRITLNGKTVKCEQSDLDFEK